MTLVEEQERRSIAANLHDNVGQTLTLSRLQLAAALRHLPAEDRLAKQLEDISNTLKQAILDTRSLVFELSSPSLNQLGLGPAIAEWMEEQIGEKHGILIEVVDNAEDVQMTADLRAILFRSLRELLTNVVKHARAKSVSLILEDEAGQLRITIQDDGIGFEPRTGSDGGKAERGFGLFSIQERMDDLGGQLEIVSLPGAGCKVVMCVPVQP